MEESRRLRVGDRVEHDRGMSGVIIEYDVFSSKHKVLWDEGGAAYCFPSELTLANCQSNKCESRKFQVGDKVVLISQLDKQPQQMFTITRINSVGDITADHNGCVYGLDSSEVKLANCQSNKCGSSSIQKAIDYLERLKGSKALDNQIGGKHYKKYLLQPAIFHRMNDLSQAEANVIDYILRAKDKNGIEDLNKAIHWIEMIKDMDYG